MTKHEYREGETVALTEQGFQMVEADFGEKGTLVRWWAYTYDEQGNLLVEQLYGRDGNTDGGRIEYVY